MPPLAALGIGGAHGNTRAVSTTAPVIASQNANDKPPAASGSKPRRGCQSQLETPGRRSGEPGGMRVNFSDMTKQPQDGERGHRDQPPGAAGEADQRRQFQRHDGTPPPAAVLAGKWEPAGRRIPRCLDQLAELAPGADVVPTGWAGFDLGDNFDPVGAALEQNPVADLERRRRRAPRRCDGVWNTMHSVPFQILAF